MNDDDAPSRALRYAAPALIAVALIAMWQGLVAYYDVPTYIIPAPSVVWRALVSDRCLRDSPGHARHRTPRSRLRHRRNRDCAVRAEPVDR
jgi:hypothetical protein